MKGVKFTMLTTIIMEWEFGVINRYHMYHGRWEVINSIRNFMSQYLIERGNLAALRDRDNMFHGCEK